VQVLELERQLLELELELAQQPELEQVLEQVQQP
jgi:hypothetical protein